MIGFAGRVVPKFTCRECGGRNEAKRIDQVFCCTPCRNAWENRRRDRGAILYDLFMEMRYRRSGAKGLWSIMCRLAEEWRGVDKEEREGRQSWRDPRHHIEENIYLTGKRGRI